MVDLDGPPRQLRPSPARTVQMLDVARRFYLDMESKVSIAQRLGISRYTVTRLLQEARDAGFVKIAIQPPVEVDFGLSRRLVEETSVERAIVLSSPDPGSHGGDLADAAASYLIEELSDDDVLGLAPTATTAAILGRIPELPACPIVQVCGISAKITVDISPVDIVRQLSSLSSGLLYPIYAPLLLDSPQSVASLRSQIGIAESVEQFDSLTRVLFTIGRWDEEGSGIYRIADEGTRQAGRDAGVVAELIGTVYIDSGGSPVAEDLAARCLGISLAQLKAVEDRVAIGRGTRSDAVLAALRAGLVTTLVTEKQAAEYVLTHW